MSPCRKPCGTHGWPERNRRDGSATAEDEAAVLGRLRTLPTTPTSDTRDREEIPGALEDLVPLHRRLEEGERSLSERLRQRGREPYLA